MPYRAFDIAQKQRGLVDRQLNEMWGGSPPPHFACVGTLLQRLYEQNSDRFVHVSLLDAACASAYYADIIQFYVLDWVEYTGIDFNPGMVAMAQRLYPELSILQGDVCNMNTVEDQSFDIVLSGATIVHIDDWHTAVKELARVTRHWLILHRTWVQANDTPTQTAKQDAYGHEVSYITINERELLDLVQSCGFILKRVVPSGERQHTNRKNLTYLFERK